MIISSKKKKKRRPTRLVLSDSDNPPPEPIVRARSASDPATEGKSLSKPVSSCALSPYLFTPPNVPDISPTSSHTSSTSTYNTPTSVTDTKTHTNVHLYSSKYFAIPSPPLQSSLYPETIVIPGPNTISQPSPPGNKTLVSPPPTLLYPATITLSTIIPTLQSSNTSTTTTYTTVNTTATTTLVHSTPITSPIASTSARLISSPKLAPLFPEHPFQKPNTPKKTRHRQTTTETETDDDEMDFQSAYILAKNKRARSPTSPLTNINPSKKTQKNKTKNPTKKIYFDAITTDSDSKIKPKTNKPAHAIAQPPTTTTTTTDAATTKTSSFPPIFI